MKIQVIFMLMLFSTFCQAQNNALVQMTFTNENSIYLRWAPNNLQLFELALKNGYTLEKINLTDKPGFTITQFETLPKQTVIFKPAITKIDSLKKINSPLLSDYLLLEPFISNKTDIKTKKMAFAYCLINAGYNKTQAENLTLLYREPVGAKFAYRISISGTNHKSEIIIANAEKNSINKPVLLEKCVQYKKTAVLTWESKSLETDFSAYYIERSVNGIDFNKITKLPTVFLSSQYEKNKLNCTYDDTTVEHGKKYYYRIQAVNHFAIETSKSNIQEVFIKNKFNPFVEFDTIKCNANKKLIYPIIKFESETEKKCCATLILMGSKNPTKNYSTILESKLFGFEGFNFCDTVNRNYFHYKLGAISIDNDTVFSSSYYFFYNDSVPPKIPVELSGIIDKGGVVTINWKKNSESDLKGYKLFYANALSEEFVEKTKDFCKSNVFTDTISLDNLDSIIFYQVVSVDSNFNHSKPSVALRLVKPDKIAPVAPVFTLINATNRGIVLKWNNSSSIDLKFTTLTRIENNTESIIKQFQKIDTTSFYYDSLLKPQINYQYKLMATDKSGNVAFNKSNYQVFEPGYRSAINEFNAKADIDKKQISLNWKAPQESVFTYRIYRSKNNTPYILFKTLDAKNTFCIDKELNQNNLYSYKIEAILMSGIHTQMSLSVEVDY